MGKKKELKFLVVGGKATPAPPIGPSLSPLGLNVPKVVAKINEATKKFEGLTVPVKVIVDTETKEFEIEVGIPTTTALLLKAVGAEKAPGNPAAEKIGDLPLEKIIERALMKKKQLLAKTLKGAVKNILGSARSIGITVEGKDPKIVSREIDEGKYDHIISKYEEEYLKEEEE